MLNGIFEMPVDYENGPNGVGKPIYANKGDAVRAQFVRVWEVDSAASIEAGREVKKPRDVILLQAKGDTNITSANVTEWHKRHYAREWAAFERGGTANKCDIQDLGLGSRQIAELRYHGINTIQELAAADEEAIKNIPLHRECIAKAKLRLNTIEFENQQESAIIQLGNLKTTVAEQSQQLEKSLQVIEELKAKLAAKEPSADEKPKRKRGRPRKVKTEESEA